MNEQASWKEKVEVTPEFKWQWRAKIYELVVSSNFQLFIAACIAINVCVLASFHEGQTQGWTTFQTVYALTPAGYFYLILSQYLSWLSSVEVLGRLIAERRSARTDRMASESGRDNSLLACPVAHLQLLGLRYRRSAVLSARHLDDESIATEPWAR